MTPQKSWNPSQKSSIHIWSTTISAKQHENQKIETKPTYIFSLKTWTLKETHDKKRKKKKEKKRNLPLKPKSLDMGTAQKTPGGRTHTAFHQRTLQREQKREPQRWLKTLI